MNEESNRRNPPVAETPSEVSCDSGLAVPVDSFWRRAPWSWFASLRAGIGLLAALVLASVVGSFIHPLERALDLVFHSWWYKTLLLALAANLGFATLRTLGRSILASPSARLRRGAGFYDSAVPCAKRRFEGDAATAAAVLRRQGYAVHTDGTHGYAIRGRLGRWGGALSHVGLIGVLLSGFASSWVAKEGYFSLIEGQSTSVVRLREKANRLVDLGFTVEVEDFETGVFPRTNIPSKYITTITAVADDGEILYRGTVEVNQSPVIRGWKFHQTSFDVIEDGARYRVRIEGPKLDEALDLEITPGQTRRLPGLERMTAALLPGAPMRWEIVDHDSDTPVRQRRGETPRPRYRFVVGARNIAHENEEPISIPLRLGEKAPLEIMPFDDMPSHDALRIVATRFEPDFVMGPDRIATSRSEALDNPALRIEIVQNENTMAAMWLFAREDLKAMMNTVAGNVAFELLEIQSIGSDASNGENDGPHEAAETEPIADDGEEWTLTVGERVPLHSTHIGVTRNPMIPVIYSGCLLMMLGLAVGFFLPRRELWFRVDPVNREIALVAAYRYARETFDGKTLALFDELSGGESRTEDRHAK